jgi:ABC-type sulfate transport system permease component
MAYSTDQLSLKKQLIDQSAHIAAAILFLTPLILSPALWSAMFAGFGLGFVRELSSQGSQVTLAKIKGVFKFWSSVDIAFWTLGGLIAWSVWH